jgi:hypothetical protein
MSIEDRSDGLLSLLNDRAVVVPITFLVARFAHSTNLDSTPEMLSYGCLLELFTRIGVAT